MRMYCMLFVPANARWYVTLSAVKLNGSLGSSLAGFPCVADRFFVPAELLQHDRQSRMGQRVVRIELQGLVQLGDCFIELAVVFELVGFVVKGDRIGHRLLLRACVDRASNVASR